MCSIIASRLLTFPSDSPDIFSHSPDTHAHNHPFGITLDSTDPLSSSSSCFFFVFFAALRFFDLLFQFESHSHTASPETIAKGERESSEQRLRRQEFFAVIIFVASQGPRENRRKSEGKCDWNLPQSDDFRSSDKASECFCGCRDFKRFTKIYYEKVFMKYLAEE